MADTTIIEIGGKHSPKRKEGSTSPTARPCPCACGKGRLPAPRSHRAPRLRNGPLRHRRPRRTHDRRPDGAAGSDELLGGAQGRRAQPPHLGGGHRRRGHLAAGRGPRPRRGLTEPWPPTDPSAVSKPSPTSTTPRPPASPLPRRRPGSGAGWRCARGWWRKSGCRRRSPARPAPSPQSPSSRTVAGRHVGGGGQAPARHGEPAPPPSQVPTRRGQAAQALHAVPRPRGRPAGAAAPAAGGCPSGITRLGPSRVPW